MSSEIESRGGEQGLDEETEGERESYDVEGDGCDVERD